MKLVVASALALLLGGHAHAEIAVIAHPENSLASLSIDELKRIYLGKLTRFPNGQKIVPMDQQEGSAARSRLIGTALGMDPANYRAYWSKMMFSGKGTPPDVLGSDTQIRAWVASNPAGLGYIDKKAVDSSVKVILTIP